MNALVFYDSFQPENYIFSKHWSDTDTRLINQHLLVNVIAKLMLFICDDRTLQKYFMVSSEDRNTHRLVSC